MALRPDPIMTPGDVFPTATKAMVCKPDYTASVRNVPWPRKLLVYLKYKTVPLPGRYELDHLIPLELGGSNSVKNLWPQDHAEAMVKDQVENLLHARVCKGNLALTTAQQQILQWWLVKP